MILYDVMPDAQERHAAGRLPERAGHLVSRLLPGWGVFWGGVVRGWRTTIDKVLLIQTQQGLIPPSRPVRTQTGVRETFFSGGSTRKDRPTHIDNDSSNNSSNNSSTNR